MGMYTGLRCELIIKDEYIDFINGINKGTVEWKDSHEDIIKDFANYKGSYFIPCGAVSRISDKWDEDKFFNRNIDINDSAWNFYCSLKNNGEIDYFIEKIVPIIADHSLRIEKFYEEWTSSEFYELIDGFVYKNEEKNVAYGYE